MTTDISDQPQLADRIKLPLTFDVEKMMCDIQNQDLRPFIYYNVMMLTVPEPKKDASGDDDVADGTWATWHDSKVLRDSPYLLSVVDSFREHCDVTLVRLLRLEAGAEVREHTDPTLGLHIKKSVVRLTIPILSNEGVTFYLNQTPVPMQCGECWYLNLTDPHQIINNGPTERINMSIDMRPNEWVKALILDAEKSYES